MIGLGFVYGMAGAVFAMLAVLSALDRQNPKRIGNAGFWGLLALSFLVGDRLGDRGNGALAVGLALISGLGLLGLGRPVTTSPAERAASAARLGNRLFVPALVIPAVVILGVVLVKRISLDGILLLDPKQATLVSLATGAAVAFAAAIWMLRQPWLGALQEGRRLFDLVGWAALLPQMLAALGSVFLLAHVDRAVGLAITGWIPLDIRLVAVCVYCLGMAGFTMIMGNAFAAFPVMTTGVALPFLIQRFGGDPAAICAFGMLSGFCGTLMTPLAANFNLVPAALLELTDRYAVIRAQAPTALILLTANTVLMNLLAFHG